MRGGGEVQGENGLPRGRKKGEISEQKRRKKPGRLGIFRDCHWTMYPKRKKKGRRADSEIQYELKREEENNVARMGVAGMQNSAGQ